VENKYIVFDSFSVSVLPSLNAMPGDLNQDGELDETDINLFIAGWRSDTHRMLPSTKYYHGDLNLDGITDLADAFQLHLALANSGAGGLDFRLLANVPEPSTLLVTVCMSGCRRRYRTCAFRKASNTKPYRLRCQYRLSKDLAVKNRCRRFSRLGENK
jgi:hypothetical protein